MELLNKSQVDALFQHETLMLGEEDVVPEYRAAGLFGREAVAFAKEGGSGRFWNCFSAGGGAVNYLTQRGFYAAAGYCNAQRLIELQAASAEGGNNARAND